MFNQGWEEFLQRPLEIQQVEDEEHTIDEVQEEEENAI
jgi:hypothetical protein